MTEKTKKSGNILNKFVIDYGKEDFPYRRHYIQNAVKVMFYFENLNVISLPVAIMNCVIDTKQNSDTSLKLQLAHGVINSITINAALFSTVAFFTLKKCAKQGLIGGLGTTDIAMISFITFPVLAILFSVMITAVLHKAREEDTCHTSYKYLCLVLDTYFTNPVTGLVVATAALIGTIKDKIEDGKHQTSVMQPY